MALLWTITTAEKAWGVVLEANRSQRDSQSGFDGQLAGLDNEGEQECDEFSIPDKILLSGSFERLSKECKSAVRRLTEVSENDERKQDKNTLNFMPFAKVTFDFQSEAHRLLSWLKLAAKTIQNKPFDCRGVHSLLMYKEYIGVFASLASSYSHVHLFTEQLSLFARPVSLSVTLPFLGETTPKSALPNPPFSPRTVLAKDYAQILKQVDSFWVKVGSQLQSFDENITEPVVLSTLQNEVSVLSALVGEVTEKTDSIYRLTRQGSAGVIDKTAYKALKVSIGLLSNASVHHDSRVTIPSAVFVCARRLQIVL
ncbi:hypothetical protein TSMEX_004899 [Taenia solium]|eukprot:TsM_000847200 transcript=TsM_000847200 gene=TsM_000847200